MEKPGGEVVLRGIDDKNRLLSFFMKKEHKNLVLRIVDILELTEARKNQVVHLCKQFGYGDKGDKDFKQYFLQAFPNGYITLSLKHVLDAHDLFSLEQLQQLIAEYRFTRQAKGQPSVEKPCAKCNGRGCKACAGLGFTQVIVEMSEEEQRLARG